jgi:hypothetical protein
VRGYIYTSGYKVIAKVPTGSCLYGTSVEGSDQDFRVIFIPAVQEILLGSGKEHHQVIENSIDTSYVSLRAFMQDLAKSQTYAVEALFSPAIEGSHTWDWILHHKGDLVSQNVASFCNYCRSQAFKYCRKGARLKALNALIDFVDEYGNKTLEDVAGCLESLGGAHDGLIGVGEDNKIVLCLGKKYYVGFDPLGRLLPILVRLRDKHGDRAYEASLAGADFKALSHAYRVSCEAKELLDTGVLTFPRPEAELLRQIRQGAHSLDECLEMIDNQIVQVEAVKLKSSVLPASVDKKVCDYITFATYMETIKRW